CRHCCVEPSAPLRQQRRAAASARHTLRGAGHRESTRRKDALQLIGPDATERRLFELSNSGELSKCKYVHFATHGFIDADRPEMSGLVLARAPSDADYDGVLHMREVFELKVNADLVVLSACQTGLGKQMGGEGVVGLSTAFFFAGTPSVVMSLWKVDDLATALLMQRLYGKLSQGKPKAESLHEAKTWLRNLTRNELDNLIKADPNLTALSRGFGQTQKSPKGTENEPHPFAHPHYWAGFVLTGDPH
ncbi:MAG: CHAT domain-containing protein, partial [Caldilineaceae bacterium]|nr:CHAT domain-containing protein [Caldilineaceae bacterium]